MINFEYRILHHELYTSVHLLMQHSVCAADNCP